jgi:hypothetical protein
MQGRKLLYKIFSRARSTKTENSPGYLAYAVGLADKEAKVFLGGTH